MTTTTKAEAKRDEWRKAPATQDQLVALRRLAEESGRTFVVGISRGQAWRRINRATRVIDRTLRQRCAPPWYTVPKRRHR